MGFVSGLLMFLLLFTAVFLIVLVLIQRGKGGGLAGAFGGMGGQSAFGTKAGDLFTKITIVLAIAWILLSLGAAKWFSGGASVLSEGMGGAAEAKPGFSVPSSTDKQPADGKGAAPAAPVQTPVKK